MSVCRLQQLVGGFILGPSFLDIVPYTKALRLLGMIGILMTAFEAGVKSRFHTAHQAYAVAFLAAISE
jgi:Kef-type K+ transport system membrane component KefB